MQESKFHFDEKDLINALNSRNLRWQDKGKYFFIQCPRHNDRHESAQLFKDTGFVHCHAGCGRFPIQQEFDELRTGKLTQADVFNISAALDRNESTPKVADYKSNYKDYNLYQFWESLPLITPEYAIKKFTADQMNDMGWRLHLEQSKYFAGKGIFIPYFSTSKKHVPYAQLRHFAGDSRRFTFLKNARMILYNFPALKRGYILLVEGASDVVSLNTLGYEAVGLPSASQNKILEKLVDFSKKNDKPIIYLGDDDTAGEAVYKFLDTHIFFYPITHGKYKDISDLLEFGTESEISRLKYDLENIIHRLKKDKIYKRTDEQNGSEKNDNK